MCPRSPEFLMAAGTKLRIYHLKYNWWFEAQRNGTSKTNFSTEVEERHEILLPTLKPGIPNY